MDKRAMMSKYYSRVDMRSSELALKYGIEDGSIVLNGDEISGRTYDAKAAIKDYFKARWNSEKKCWTVTENFDFARLIFAEGLIVS